MTAIKYKLYLWVDKKHNRIKIKHSCTPCLPCVCSYRQSSYQQWSGVNTEHASSEVVSFFFYMQFERGVKSKGLAPLYQYAFNYRFGSLLIIHHYTRHRILKNHLEFPLESIIYFHFLKQYVPCAKENPFQQLNITIQKRNACQQVGGSDAP